MENTELLEAISRMMDEKLGLALQPINTRLDKIDSRLNQVDSRLDKMDSRLDKVEADIGELKETCEVTRVAVNSLIDWTDEVSTIDRLPLPKVKG